MKKQLCPNCKVGKESYELDVHSLLCPYISWYKDGNCSYFVPLDEDVQNAEQNDRDI